MASADDVKKLAALARIDIPESDLERFSKEFDGILTYVGQLNALEVSKEKHPSVVRNVLREDGVPHEGGLHTSGVTNAFPDREGNALKVKQIISHD